ncbi:hypothetical protein PIB30_077353 [Stylosanthes scabra]|uniref:Uncharacterized protein n=1 Tax=Stylosanthes scabra TaxID=79078 RepID=A0ABU6UU82_9FABA|nr:hypothetical protein [Stylosanthes scabra]
MKIVHSASSEATPSKLPFELQFEWVNFSNLNFIGPQHYALLETDGQLKAHCGVMDKRKWTPWGWMNQDGDKDGVDSDNKHAED